ncbi:MAG: (2Fe-2S) ferredoxin domain-containing protein [Erysipelotrichaceae bacterium]
MITIEVCIGSACFVRGSNVAVQLLKDYIKENEIEAEVVLKGSFCMQKCTKGLGVKIDGIALEGIGLHNVVSEVAAKLEEKL